MTGYIVDRRLSGGNKSVPNRTRFLRRVKARVAAQVKKMIDQGSIEGIFRESKKIVIPVGDLSEPNPSYDRYGGKTDMVVSGNEHFRVGDLIPKKGGQGQGNGGNGAGDGSGGEGEDDFVFSLTRDEFIQLFFEDLELPNLINTDIQVAENYRQRKAGFTTDGSPQNLNLLHTMKQSAGRRMALRAEKKRKVKELEAQLAGLVAEQDTIKAAIDADNFQGTSEEAARERLVSVTAEIETVTLALDEAKKKVKKVPFIDDIDLRYRNTIVEPEPTTRAVMFCLMDVSGSMTQWHKDIAKRFYMLLFLFLHKRYEKVDIVFVRHHHDAQEVDEQEFFYGRVNGGTVVSEGLKKVNEIINERYSSRWNIYVAQASDGDNWQDDEAKVLDLMQKSILPKVQYFFYIEISKYGREGDLWQQYQKLGAENFDCDTVTDAADIYHVFRKMFSKN